MSRAALTERSVWPNNLHGESTKHDSHQVLSHSLSESIDPLEAWRLPSSTQLVLSDANSYLGPEFKVPTELRAAVEFWLRVYTQLTTQQIVLFDDRHLDVVYEVIDLHPIAARARNRMAYEIMAHKKVTSILHVYKQAFARLARLKNQKETKPQNETERRILAAWEKSPHHHSYAQISRTLRSQTGQRDNLISGLESADSYLPKMESIFIDAGVPPELTRLSLVESSFNLHAVSRLGAVGVWQFMKPSAKEYMIVNEGAEIDERRSILKSTQAAAQLLKRNRKGLGNWALAVTAYNSGFSGIFRIPHSLRESPQLAQVFDGCKQHGYFGWAGRNYYASFLAVIYAEAYRDLYFSISRATDYRGFAFRKATGGETLSDLARRWKVPLEELKASNPDIGRRDHPLPRLPRGYRVAVPQET